MAHITIAQLQIYCAEYLETGKKTDSYLKAFPEQKEALAQTSLWTTAYRFHKKHEVQEELARMREQLAGVQREAIVMSLNEKRVNIKQLYKEATRPWEKNGVQVPLAPAQITAALKAIELDAKLMGEFKEEEREAETKTYVIALPETDSKAAFLLNMKEKNKAIDHKE